MKPLSQVLSAAVQLKAAKVTYAPPSPLTRTLPPSQTSPSPHRPQTLEELKVAVRSAKDAGVDAQTCKQAQLRKPIIELALARSVLVRAMS